MKGSVVKQSGLCLPRGCEECSDVPARSSRAADGKADVTRHAAASQSGVRRGTDRRIIAPSRFLRHKRGRCRAADWPVLCSLAEVCSSK